MHHLRTSYLSLFVALILSCQMAVSAQAQSNSDLTAAAASPLPNGIVVVAGSLHEEVTALRDDVLRIRMWRGDVPPEDASWAVLAAARHSSAPVATANANFGFSTKALSVEVNQRNLELTIRDKAGNILQQDARPLQCDGAAFRLYKQMPLDEHYFGLGDKAGPLDRRNEAFTLWNTDAYRFQSTTDPLYKSIPYFMSYRAGRAVGTLLDNTWRTSFDFGKEREGIYSFGSAGGPIDYYVFYGPAPKQVVETYAWLTGTPPLPPIWSLGFQQSRYSYMSQQRLLQVAHRLRADHIPADVLYLDIDFQDRNRPFTVNTEAFPDLPGMIAQLKNENFHLVLITDLHIARAPGQNYHPYDSGIAGDEFLKNPDGSVYTGKVWPGPSVFPDFTRQQTRAWWGSLYTQFQRDGADGFWNDMNEPSIFDSPTLTIPEDVIHRIDEPGFKSRTATHAEIHNVFGMENSRATYEGLRALDPDKRPFVLTRASYAGGQRYAATWTGDNSSSWVHLNLATSMLENLGLSGFAFSGADVGGFAGTPSTELLTKWLEIAAFQPIDRDHTEKGSGDQEPWVGGPAQEAIRRRFIETRYELMPYLYTLADEATRTGLPMMRPLFLEFPDAAADRHPLDIDPTALGEFMLGSDLLIAPAHYPDELDQYAAELPSPNWYDFWTGDRAALPASSTASASNATAAPDRNAPFSVNIKPELERLPVFVRAGAILPMAPLVQSTDATPEGPLTLRIYAGDSCSGSLYQDDGKTYAYKDGAYLRMSFSCHETEHGMTVTISPHMGAYPAWWKQIHAEVFGWSPTQGILLVNSKPVSTRVERTAHGVEFTIADDGKGEKVELQ